MIIHIHGEHMVRGVATILRYWPAIKHVLQLNDPIPWKQVISVLGFLMIHQGTDGWGRGIWVYC